MDRLLPDIRYSFRRMAKSPGFTSIAILSLALGIGANTAIFSLVNSILLSGVPMRAPQELVEIYTSEEDDGYPYSISAYPDLVDLRERTDLFAGVRGLLLPTGDRELHRAHLGRGGFLEHLPSPGHRA